MSIKHLVVPLCAALALAVAACGATTTAVAARRQHRQAGEGHARAVRRRSRSRSARPAPITAGWRPSPTTPAQQADELDGVTLKLAEGVTDSAAQADQIETLIAAKPDALVVLPNEGDALTPVALKAMAAGIPVVNVDREFAEPGAYRTLITGDNYGIGYKAGNYFADQLKC